MWNKLKQWLHPDHITRSSIKEGFDDLPAAVCYFTPDGIIRLCNRQMFRVYRALSGRDLQSLEELRQQVKKHAEELGGEESGFYYGMVARYTYGDADNRTCRFDIARQPSGLWTACFHYDGETPFQSEDWLYLHEHAGRVPMLAIHACADFAADKGMTVFTGGQTLDEWSQMAEIWFWLMEQYEIGNPPEEAVQHLKKLEGIMRQSDFDMTIPELLRGCIDHLNDDIGLAAHEIIARALLLGAVGGKRVDAGEVRDGNVLVA